MENKNTALVKSNTALTRVSNQIAITNRLLEVADPFLIPYRKGDKWGFCDRDKRIVIECVYDEVDFFSEGLAAVRSNDKYGFIDKTGSLAIPTTFDNACPFNISGLAKVDQKEKILLIDGNGITKFSFQESLILNMNDSYQIWDLNNKYNKGLINISGDFSIPVIYDFIGKTSDKLISTKNKSGKFGFFNEKGALVIPFLYAQANPFQEGFSSVCKQDNNWGFINKQNYEVIQFIYQDAKSFKNNGVAAVKLNDKWGFIDREGIQVGSFLYDEIQYFPGNFDAVRVDNKWGMLDTVNDNLVLPCIYDDIKYAGNKYSKWSSKGHRMYFDHESFEFEKGFYNVKLGVKWGMIDINGNFKFPMLYDYIHYWSEGFVSLCINGQSGFSNMIGELVIPLQYKFVGSFVNGIAIIKNEEKFGALNNNGDTIIPFIGFSADILNNGIGIIHTINSKGNVQKNYFDNKGLQFWED